MVTDKATLVAACIAVMAMLSVSGCVSDDQAVDMGLATKCDVSGTVAKLGDPAARFVTQTRVEVCRGPRRDSYNETTVLLSDCQNGVQFQLGVLRQSADPARRGADYDVSALVDREVLRLKVGLTDISTMTAGLQTAGVTVRSLPGAGAAECAKLAAQAVLLN